MSSNASTKVGELLEAVWTTEPLVGADDDGCIDEAELFEYLELLEFPASKVTSLCHRRVPEVGRCSRR